MTKRKRAIIITLSAIGIVLLTIAMVLFCSLTNQPAEFFATCSAKKKAADYVKEKYGDNPHICSAEPVYSGGFMFDRGRLCGALVSFDTFDVLVSDDRASDNRQYSEITTAFTEKYLSVNEIYSNMTECSVTFDFGEAVSDTNYGAFNRDYFDGDITKFLGETNPRLSVVLDGQGFHEKRAETTDLLSKLLEQISFSTSGDMRVYAYVSDPESDLPNMPLAFENSSLRYAPKKYDAYMELIAAGSIVRENGSEDIMIQQPSFYTIDAYTAIADIDIASPITSEQDFFFHHKDYSENTTAYRGRYKYDNYAEKNVLTIKENGLYCGMRDAGQHDFLLRLDRAYYGITDSTIALRITPPVTAEKWLGKQLYLSFGYDGYDCDENHWYYMDDEYLYIYVPHFCSDLWPFEDGRGVYIAFAEIDGLNAAIE